MAFAIARISKLKGGSVGASDSHNNRARETPNADPERRDQNRILIGDDLPLTETVRQVIRESGGKPRRDSVECVEVVLTASREYFENDKCEIALEKVEQFTERSVKFLRDKERVGLCVKAILHLDERTPHIQAHCVPLDERGKLNCKGLFGSRSKLRAFQDAFYEEVKDLGLERGVRGSRATHVEINKFYGAILEDSRISIDQDKLPDPPKILMSRQGIDAYKARVIEAIHEQIEKPLRALRHQAMLAREERNKREEAEQRGAERVNNTEKQAAERIAVAERAAEEAVARFELESRQNLALWNQNDRVHRANDRLIKEVVAEKSRSYDLSINIERLRAQVTDIPLTEVLARFGHTGEVHSQTHIYRDSESRITMIVADNTLYDLDRRPICSNALELVMHVRDAGGIAGTTREQALAWLADNFGAGRAAAAYLAERQQAVSALFNERNPMRERASDMTREPSQQQDRPSFSHGR